MIFLVVFGALMLILSAFIWLIPGSSIASG